MDLLIVRHGIAQRVSDGAGMLDAHRALTQKGRRRMRQIASGLGRRIKGIDRIFTSPYARALQTADILAIAFDDPVVTELQSLAPDGNPADVVRNLGEIDPEATVAVVGHQPYLGDLAGRLLGAPGSRFLDLRPGGVCCIRWPGAVEPGAGRLQWLARPGDLRRLRKA